MRALYGPEAFEISSSYPGSLVFVRRGEGHPLRLLGYRPEDESVPPAIWRPASVRLGMTYGKLGYARLIVRRTAAIRFEDLFDFDLADVVEPEPGRYAVSTFERSVRVDSPIGHQPIPWGR